MSVDTILSCLTHREFNNLCKRLHKKMEYDLASGYQRYGWDDITLAVISPEWYETVMIIRKEIKRRRSAV